ncbi:MAG: hypothetical protein KA998_00120 [Rickettsiaceae bacterium]|nr:hypothetical protein [Rickettsiaceae bacterium]
MESTGKFDINNQEIFVGDKVLKAWGFFEEKGKMKPYFKIHTIIKEQAYLMGDGNMRNDIAGNIFILGKTYNTWKGKDVKKLTKEEMDIIGMEEEVRFFFNEEKKACRFGVKTKIPDHLLYWKH